MSTSGGCSNCDENSVDLSKNWEIADNRYIKKKYEDDDWKATIMRDISELRNRVALLEFKNADNLKGIINTKKKIVGLKQSNSDSLTSARYVEKCRCMRLTPVVALQSFWMFVCVVTFLGIGISQFLVAEANQKSPWKPEKKAYVIDYTRDNAVQYDMPIIWLTFGFSSYNSSKWTENMMNDTLTHLLEIQSYLYNASYLYVSNEHDQVFVDCEAISVSNVVSLDENFYATLALKCEDPDTSLGDFLLSLHMNMSDYSTLYNVDQVSGFHIFLGRETGNWYDGPYLAFDRESSQVYGIEYQETVVHRLNDRAYSFFDTTLQSQGGGEFGDPGQVYSMIKGDLLVEHWKEYLSYSYVDWFMAMGGLFSVCVTVFLLGGSMIPRLLRSNSSMGILPLFSYTFYNYGKVLKFTKFMNTIETEKNIS